MIEYDNLNRPRYISVESDVKFTTFTQQQNAQAPQSRVFVLPPNDSTTYTYTPDGEKIRVTHVVNKSVPFVSTDPTRPVWPTRTIKIRDTTEYIGPFVICNGKLDKVLFNGGYVTFGKTDLSEQTYHYFSTDHQGNVRAVYDEKGNIEQAIAYDPFGVIIPDLSTGADIQPYLYNGKELDRVHGLNWYDYGARMYDVTIGRWTFIDPLCEKYYHVSPYAYGLDNPVRFIDKDGLAPGDFFFTADEAAIDFGLFYNDNSIRNGLEYSSAIFKVFNSKGQMGYSYTLPNIGINESVEPAEAHLDIHLSQEFIHMDVVPLMIKLNIMTMSFLASDEITMIKKLTIKQRKAVTNMTDIGNANKDKINSYIATPNGSLQKYNYKTGEITTISEQMPSDSNDPTRLNSSSVYIGNNDLDIEKQIEIMRKILHYKF